MPDRPDYMEEAVAAAAKARHGRVHYENWADVGGERRALLLEEARLDLQEAEPFIRRDERAKLASEGVGEALADFWPPIDVHGRRSPHPASGPAPEKGNKDG